MKNYIIGFLLSVTLTLVAYFLVVYHVASGHIMPPDEVLLFLLPGLAVIQMCIQMYFFLHIGHESKPRWNLLFFLSTMSLVLVIIIGSLWIMNHLNYNMTPQAMTKFIIKDEGIHR